LIRALIILAGTGLFMTLYLIMRPVPARRGVKPAPIKGDEVKTSEGAPDIRQEVYIFKVEGFDENRKVKWKLEGRSANVVADKINISDLKGVYYGDGETFTVFADKAVYNKKTQDIELKDNVVGKSSDDGEMVTDYANWNAKNEEITTDSYVVIKRQNIVCTGRGLVTRPRLKWATFRKDVEVDIAPDKKIFCRGPFEINHEKNVAIFNNNVKIIDRESETFTDKLTVYLDPDTNEVERVVTEGNVRIVHTGDARNMGTMSF
jgi:LPS export ABC transporter protein LptC